MMKIMKITIVVSIFLSFCHIVLAIIVVLEKIYDTCMSMKDLFYTNLLKHEHLNKNNKPCQTYICYPPSSKKILKGKQK